MLFQFLHSAHRVCLSYVAGASSLIQGIAASLLDSLSLFVASLKGGTGKKRAAIERFLIVFVLDYTKKGANKVCFIFLPVFVLLPVHLSFILCGLTQIAAL